MGGKLLLWKKNIKIHKTQNNNMTTKIAIFKGKKARKTKTCFVIPPQGGGKEKIGKQKQKF